MSCLRVRYCWRTLLAVIWTALVAQEGASNANGEGPCRGSRPFWKLGHLAIQLGFANSIRSFDETASGRCQRNCSWEWKRVRRGGVSVDGVTEPG